MTTERPERRPRPVFPGMPVHLKCVSCGQPCRDHDRAQLAACAAYGNELRKAGVIPVDR